MESLAVDTRFSARVCLKFLSISCRYSNFLFFVDVLSIESISAVLTGRIVQGMKPIQGCLRNLMATVHDQETRELLQDTIALIEVNRRQQRIVPDTRLHSTRICRQHFLQWYPQAFMPGPIWQSVSYLPDREYCRQRDLALCHGSCPVLCTWEIIGTQ